MKKIILMLVPVLPGFDAWAVNGFVEYVEKPDDSSNRPMAIPSSSVEALVHGFQTSAGDMVFIPYSRVASAIREVDSLSGGHVSIQPLDRGGVLVSGELTAPGAEKLSHLVALPNSK